MTEQVAIVGAGHAAGQLVASLRQHKYEGRIVLIGDEPYLPYQRPPLSKKFLAGDLPAERLYVKPASFYDDPSIELRLGTRVESIDRERRRLHTDKGDSVGYDTLVLAPGSRVRRLTLQGADIAGVHYLRTIQDVERIRGQMSPKKKLVVIGAGYIGLEVAAVSRQLGLDVTVVEMTDRVMSRVVSPEISDFYEIEHSRQGVRFHLNTGVVALHGNGSVEAVETSDGQLIPADIVVVGIGIVPNVELAANAGVATDNGIVVDDRCASSDPAIYAVGDCTTHPNAIYGRSVRLESVHNALEQAKTAAANICGIESHYSQVPWFWSDQYDLKLQIAGLSAGYDTAVIRGNPAERAFACLYLRDSRLIATDAINAPKDFVQSKALIASRAPLDAAQLADATVQLRDLSV